MKYKIEVSSDEEELITALRNYRKAYPNGEPWLLYYAQQVFDRISESPL